VTEGVVSNGVLDLPSADLIAAAIFASSPCAEMCKYIVFGDAPSTWL
jgi:hypothetical protein